MNTDKSSPARADSEPTLRAALAELVASKDLKKLADSFLTPGRWASIERREAAIDDYNRREPLAWEAARAALASVPAPDSAPAELPKGLLPETVWLMYRVASRNERQLRQEVANCEERIGNQRAEINRLAAPPTAENASPAVAEGAEAAELVIARTDKELTREVMIDFLVQRRQDLGGSVSEHNHRRNLETQSTADLRLTYRRIEENERRARRAAEGLQANAAEPVGMRDALERIEQYADDTLSGPAGKKAADESWYRDAVTFARNIARAALAKERA